MPFCASCHVFVMTGQSVNGISEQIISECEFSLEISERIIGKSEFSLENSRQLQQYALRKFGEFSANFRAGQKFAIFRRKAPKFANFVELRSHHFFTILYCWGFNNSTRPGLEPFDREPTCVH